MLLIVTANVIFRYGFNASISWADQVTAHEALTGPTE